MKRLKLFAFAVLGLSAGAAQAQPISGNPPTTTIVCLDVGGHALPTVCRTPASRIDQREDICICPTGIRTEAPVCPPGVKPPAETRAFEQARREAMRGGSLVGATWEGQPMCVAPRNSRPTG
jgi:hypothetical protein